MLFIFNEIKIIKHWDSDIGLAKIKVEDGRRIKYKNIFGITIIDTNDYEYMGKYNDGLAVVLKDGKYGYIDTKGKIAIDFQYYNTHGFSEGLAMIYNNGKYAFIDKNGNIAIDCSGYDEVYNFSEGLAVVRKNGKFGYVDKKGNLVVDCVYDTAANFENGIAYVKDNNKSIKINKKGWDIDTVRIITILSSITIIVIVLCLVARKYEKI